MNGNEKQLNKLINITLANLSNIQEQVCIHDCHNCNFSIYDDGWGDVCAFEHLINELPYKIKK